MKILFDHGTPAPLRHQLPGHEIATAYEMGWARLSNGDLLAAAEKAFAVFITTDKNLRYQQNLAGRRLAILVLPTTSWPEIQKHTNQIVAGVAALQPGDFVELSF
jgi:predicted nuclease of predicted toxin-antitoxin system